MKYSHTQSFEKEAASVRKLLDLIEKKTNRDFDQFCEALHQTRQTHVVQQLLVTPGTAISLHIMGSTINCAFF